MNIEILPLIDYGIAPHNSQGQGYGESGRLGLRTVTIPHPLPYLLLPILFVNLHLSCFRVYSVSLFV